MLNPWILLGVALVWAASLFAVGSWQRTDGARAEKVAWQARDNAELVAANAEIAALNAAARKTEQAHEQRVADIATNYAKEKTDYEAKGRRDFDDALSGAIRLHVRATCKGPAPGGGAEAPAAPGGGDGSESIELPREIAGDLLRLADDADQVAAQLTACQRIVLSDRVP